MPLATAISASRAMEEGTSLSRRTTRSTNCSNSAVERPERGTIDAILWARFFDCTIDVI